MGFVPTLVAVTVVSFLVVSHAPTKPLAFARVAEAWGVVGWPGLVALVLASLAVSITLQPLQFRLVQLMEGYWSSPLLDGVFRLGIRRQARRRDGLRQRLTGPPDGVLAAADVSRMEAAADALRTRFPSDDRLLPTALGNVLRAAEDKGASRWNASAVTLWPRIFPLLPPEYASSLEDEVLQLDLSARLCVTWAIAGVTSVLLLATSPLGIIRDPAWALACLALFTLSWLSYRGAIESALAHGRDIEVTVDLHKGLLIDALRFPEPRAVRHEQRLLAHAAALLQTYDASDVPNIRYRPSNNAGGSRNL